jgi:hypothetical protein
MTVRVLRAADRKAVPWKMGEVVQTCVEGEELVVRAWRPGGAVRTHRRR